MQGTLAVASDANLGLGSTIELSGGTLQATASFTSAKGFTSNLSTVVGSVDTAGNNLSFAGPNTGYLNKKGLGTLTLTNPATGNTTASGGVLALPNATSGSATINSGGTLQAAGTLSSLTWSAFSGTATLDIGGPAVAKVTTGSATNNSNNLLVDFGIGSLNSDFWAISSGPTFFPTNAGAFQFEFQNLGGAKTGVDYPLMSFSTFSAPSTSVFALAPDMAAAGWAGTFKTTTTGVSVRFSSLPVPEPTAIILVFQSVLISFAAFRFRRRKRIAPDRDVP